MTPPKPPPGEPFATMDYTLPPFNQVPAEQIERMKRRDARAAAGDTVQPYKRKTMGPGDIVTFRRRSLMFGESTVWNRPSREHQVRVWLVVTAAPDWLVCRGYDPAAHRWVSRRMWRPSTDHLMDTVYQPPRSRRA